MPVACSHCEAAVERGIDEACRQPGDDAAEKEHPDGSCRQAACKTDCIERPGKAQEPVRVLKCLEPRYQKDCRTEAQTDDQQEAGDEKFIQPQIGTSRRYEDTPHSHEQAKSKKADDDREAGCPVRHVSHLRSERGSGARPCGNRLKAALGDGIARRHPAATDAGHICQSQPVWCRGLGNAAVGQTEKYREAG